MMSIPAFFSPMIDIFHLLSDSEACAAYLGLQYKELDSHCYRRRRCGKGFIYERPDHRVTDPRRIAYFKSLAIPPAWKDVAIATQKKAYILATGVDEEQRKQYIYHPEWFTGRELMQFYKLIFFGNSLPEVRTWVQEHLQRDDGDQVLAGMLLTLDLTAIRVGNQNYYDEHDTVGLTTLRKEHIKITKEGVTFHFMGKSGQEIHTIAANEDLMRFYEPLLKHSKGFLFPDIDPAKINLLIQDITGKAFTAKDFRTWGGTVWAYEKLVTERSTPLEALDHAASMLGNTRSVARTYYVHPHMMEAYEEPAYKEYFYNHNSPRGSLSAPEANLLRLLKRLKKDKFDTQFQDTKA